MTSTTRLPRGPLRLPTTWRRVPPQPVVAAVLAVALVAVLSWLWPAGVPLVVLRLTQFSLAAGAAYLLDDATATLTSVSPRRIWARRVPAVAYGGGAMAIAWVAVLMLLGRQAGSWDWLIALTVETSCLVCGAVAVAALVARRGDPEPGGLAAPIVMLVSICLLIAGPLLRTGVFISDEAPHGVILWAGWGVLASVALLVILICSRDPASGRLRGGLLRTFSARSH
jgi:hypothetical protein